MDNFTISDGLIILATLLSPMLAVQAQKWIEGAREKRDAQKQVFYDLMATRASRLAAKHVEALNRIDLEFTGRGKNEKAVLNRWRIYADHLNSGFDESNEAQKAQWFARSDDTFLDLLEALSAALGYQFNRVEISKGIYKPRGHGQAEIRQEMMQHAFLELLFGNRALKMAVTSFPGDDDALDLQKKAFAAVIGAIDGDGAIKVTKS
jgi:hypothetical protein